MKIRILAGSLPARLAGALSVQACNVPTSDSGRCAGLSVTYEGMMSAGRRLHNALRLERYFDSLYSECQTDEVFDQLKQARRLVDQSVEDYTSATQRYREAMSPARQGMPDR